MYSFLGSEDDVRSRVLDVLSSEWPLTVRKLHYHLKRDEGVVTYQEVNKAVRKLVAAGALVETKKQYAVSLEWLGQTKNQVAQLSVPRNVPRLDFSRLKEQNDSISLTFASYAESLYAFLAAAHEDFSNSRHRLPVVSHWYRACPSIAIAREHFFPVKRFLESRPHYVLCCGNSKLDVLLMDFWKEFGSKVKFGSSSAFSANVVVTEDRVIQLFLTPQLKAALDDLYESSNSASVNLGGLYRHIFSWEHPVSVVVTKNAALAEQIRVETLSHFV